jgi:hypothetical protein
MSDPYDIRQDLEPDSGEDLVALGNRLLDARPVPRPAFRGDLGRRLAARSARRGLGGAQLRALIAANGLAGLLLLVVGAVSAAGVGPLG